MRLGYANQNVEVIEIELKSINNPSHLEKKVSNDHRYLGVSKWLIIFNMIEKHGLGVLGCLLLRLEQYKKESYHMEAF